MVVKWIKPQEGTVGGTRTHTHTQKKSGVNLEAVRIDAQHTGTGGRHQSQQEAICNRKSTYVH